MSDRGFGWSDDFLCYVLHFICQSAMLAQTGMPKQGVFQLRLSGLLQVPWWWLSLQLALCAGTGHGGWMPFFHFYGRLCLGLHSGRKLLAMVFICGIISLIITLTKVRKMIIESIPGSLQQLFQLGSGSFTYVGIKNAGLLKFSIDPGNYTVAGKGSR